MLRVCIIDDHPLVRDALAMSFEAAAFKVSTAEDLATAISCIKATAPHIVLADLQQPGVDDASIVAALTAAFPALPIIAMSGNPELANKARSLGAIEFVAKPFRMAVLAPRLRELALGTMTAAA